MTVDSIPTRRPRSGQPTLLRASKLSQDVPLTGAPIALPQWGCLARIMGMQSARLAQWAGTRVRRDLPTREATRRCLSRFASEWCRFAGWCTNTARCPDHVLLRTLLCWLDPQTGAGSWLELRHSAGAAAKHFGDPSRVGYGQAAFDVPPESPAELFIDGNFLALLSVFFFTKGWEENLRA